MSGTVGVIEAPQRLRDDPVPEHLQPPVPLRRSPGRARVEPRGLAAAIGRALDERRLFVLVPFAMITGVVASISGSAEPHPFALITVAAVLAVALLLAVRSIAAFRVLTLAASFWTGFALLTAHGALFGTQMLARPAYGTYQARVDEIVVEAGDVHGVVLSSITPLGDARGVPIRRASVDLSSTIDFAPGDIVRATIWFSPVPGPVLPGGFDPQFHAYFDGVGAYGRSTGLVERVAIGERTLDRLVDAVRGEMGARIDAVMSGATIGIARSMMIGDQSHITDNTREIMAESGLAHIYSISGLHLSIVAGGVLLVLRLLLAAFPNVARFGSAKKAAAFVAILVAFAYLLLAGGSSNVPAFRSTLMIVLVFGAVLVGRRALTMRNIAIAALVIVVTDPASILRPSFQLSFAAVVALIGIYETLRTQAEPPETGLLSRAARLIAATALTSLIAGAATLPFSAYHFQQTAPLGMVANVMALFLIGPIMASIVLAALAMPFGFETPFLLALQYAIDALLWIAGTVSAWSGGFSLHPLLTPSTLIFSLAALAWFAFIPTWHRLIGPALLVPAILVLAVDEVPDVLVADETQTTVLRLDGGLKLVAGGEDSFALRVWQKTYNVRIEPAEIACDSIACIAQSPRGFSAAVVFDPAGFYEECGADLVITRRVAPRVCSVGMVIDENALAAGGVHWLRWDADAGRFEVRLGTPDRNRPWRPPL